MKTTALESLRSESRVTGPDQETSSSEQAGALIQVSRVLEPESNARPRSPERESGGNRPHRESDESCPNRESDESWMDLALEQAQAARALDEVPIGAIIVLEGRVIAADHNRTRTQRDPTAHAEMLALRAAVGAAGALRIPGAVVYTTVEPCFMCAGALSHARVARVVWAVRDPKFGGCVSLGNVLDDPRLNHRIQFTEDVRAQAARDLLQKFFRAKR